MDILPVEKDISFFQEHGWWVSPKIIPDEVIDSLVYASERYYSGERDTPLLVELYNDWTPEKGNVLRQNDYISLQINEFHDFLQTSILGQVAGILGRTTSIRLFHDQLIFKPRQVDRTKSAVGWHIDKAYWHTCSSNQMLTAWIPLQDCTQENGTLLVIDKSHRWEHGLSQKSFHSNDMEGLEQTFREINPGYTKVPLILKKGQVSFHHCQTIHGSFENLSDAPRIAYAIHFQDDSNAYQKKLDKFGNAMIHTNDIICRTDSAGNPDYSDPDVCQEFWRID